MLVRKNPLAMLPWPSVAVLPWEQIAGMGYSGSQKFQPVRVLLRYLPYIHAVYHHTLQKAPQESGLPDIINRKVAPGSATATG